MRVIPVLDLKDGEVVRGVAGRRQEYRPIRSRLSDSSRPVDVAGAFRERLNLRDLYLADLNAIAGEPPAFKTMDWPVQADMWRTPGVEKTISSIASRRYAITACFSGVITRMKTC